jgi:sialic acid synthase SpsE
MKHQLFEDLFVLEMANNHWGKVERGLKIIQDFGKVVRFNDAKAAMKLQFRDVDRFIHKDYRSRSDIRYIKKTLDTHLSWENYALLTKAVRENGMITMATPFDEVSVDKCVELNVQIVKLASSDIKDWVLIEKVASVGKPVIASTGGSTLKDMDDLIAFFNKRRVPFALNHCVSIYPSEDSEVELNQIDFLRERYPENVIGYSTHEYTDWHNSVMMAYAKGARTFERHVDIDFENLPVSPYCSRPENVDDWFKSYKKAKEMCGPPGTAKRNPPDKETKYLDGLVRGVYAAKDLPVGHVIADSDVYLAIPLLQGQISCRELMRGEVLIKPINKDAPVDIAAIDSPYADSPSLQSVIMARGLPRQ